MLPTLLAVAHLSALACGVAVLFQRAAALRRAEDAAGLRSVFFWDNIAGGVGAVWMGSGLWRVLGDYDKGTDYYVSSPVFWIKMSLIASIWAVECVPMVEFIRYRIKLARGDSVSLARKGLLLRLHWLEFALIVLTVACAASMARGVGAPSNATTNGGANGARLYGQYCSACHQVDGRGLDGTLAADLVGGNVLAKTDEQLLRSISNGVSGTAMPAFATRLSEVEQKAVLRYVRSTFGPAPH